jgi:hypothetical protein
VLAVPQTRDTCTVDALEVVSRGPRASAWTTRANASLTML